MAHKKMPINSLWEAACSGDTETLSSYYDNGGERNRRYTKFNRDHSLIAGAYRNNQMEVVDLLLAQGETVMEHERQELKEISYRSVIRAATDLLDHMKYHNSNLTKAQMELLSDLAVAIYNLNGAEG